MTIQYRYIFVLLIIQLSFLSVKGSCPEGQYELAFRRVLELGDGCAYCHQICKSCADSEKNCIQCSAGYYKEEELFRRRNLGIMNSPCYKCHETCLTCSDNNRCNNSGCKVGFYELMEAGEGQHNCGQCHYLCEACENDQQCLACIDGYYLTGVNSGVIGASNCKKCHESCEVCTDDSPCSQCPISQYVDEETELCMPCSKGCATCNGPLQWQCLSCSVGYYYRFVPSRRNLQGRESLTQEKECVPCTQTGCKECSEFRCLKCKVGYYEKLFGEEDEIEPGLYMIRDRVLQETDCVECDSGCKSCQKYGCLSCSQGYYFSPQLERRNLSTILGECFICHPTCATCSNDLPCETKCPAQFVFVEDECLRCDIKCDLCEESATQCTKCSMGYYMDENNNCQSCHNSCSSCTNNLPCNECPVGKYTAEELERRILVDEDQCNADCIRGCASCQNGDSCTSCIEGYYFQEDEPRRRNLQAQSGNCLECDEACLRCNGQGPDKCSKCAMGYYLSYELEIGRRILNVDFERYGRCIKCHESCGNICINSDPCEEEILCPQGQFQEDTRRRILDLMRGCSYCNLVCKNCTDFQQNCDACSDGYYKEEEDPMRRRLQTIHGSKCQKCHPSCLYCEDSTKCDPAGCKLGFYYKSNPQQGQNHCQQCHSLCIYCTNNQECQVCIDGYYTVFRGTQGPDGAKNCTKCHKTCETCENGDPCLSCPVGEYLDQETETCNKCYDGCASCQGSAYNQCLSCLPGHYYELEEFRRNLAGREDLNSLKVCKPCRYEQCQECSKTKCLQCKVGYAEKRINLPNPVLYTIRGRVYEEINCIKCEEGCKYCIESAVGNCLNCADGYYIEGVPSRRNLDTIDPLIGSCIKCHPTCATCFNSQPCHNKCPAQYYQDSPNSCDKCDKKCDLCLNSPTNCTKCAVGYYMNKSNQCIQCHETCYRCSDELPCNECPVGKYSEELSRRNLEEGEEDKCNASCKDECAKCRNKFNCTSCKEGFYLQINFRRTLLEEEGQCESCAAECLSCNAQGSQNCSKCVDGYYLDYQVFDRRMLDVDFERYGQCQKCHPTCVYCLDGSPCSDCQPGYYKEYAPPSRRVLDGDGDECMICPSVCSLCQEANKCLKCQEGYYLNNSKPQQGTMNCFKCHESCSSCTDDQPCGECPLGQFNEIADRRNLESEPNCQYCYPTCKTCVGQYYDQCTSCADGYFKELERRILSRQLIPSFRCQQCQENCKTCDSPRGCKTCKSGYYAEENEWRRNLQESVNCSECMKYCEICNNNDSCDKCYEGFYFDSDEKKCVSCHPSCPNCSSSQPCNQCLPGQYQELLNRRVLLAINCQNCNPICLYCDTENSCARCIPGYYYKVDSTVTPKNCIKCHESCETCVDEKPCQLCPNGQYQSEWEEGMGERRRLPTLICNQCGTNCATCENSHICKTCKNGYYYEIEPTRRNLVGGGLNCNSCHENCITCFDKYTCERCVKGYYFNSGQGGGGELEPDYINCVKCHISCKNGCVDDEPCQRCGSGYYDSLIDEGSDDRRRVLSSNVPEGCLPCDSICLKCENNRSCTSCKDGYYFEIELEGDESGHDNCHACPPNCRSCKLDDETILCEVCSPGYFLNSNVCTKCSSVCAECENSQENCTQCAAGAFRNMIKPQCGCQDGYRSSTESNDCIENACHNSCQTCSGFSENDCLTCPIGRTHLPGDDGGGQCVCANGYYQSGSDCVKCPYPCEECEDAVTCKSCVNLENRNNDVKCLCLEGFFDNGQKCEECSKKCKKCENKATNCTECRPGLFRNMEDVKCGCVSGYYDIGENYCIKCSSQCESCSNSELCDKCRNKDLLPPLCEKENKEYFSFDTPTGKQDGKCDKKCDKCKHTSSNCIQCVSGKNRSPTPPQCECKLGYHDNNGQQRDCELCPPECISCQSQNICTACKEDLFRKLNIYTGECECIPGYKEVQGILVCQKCYAYKDQCLLVCPKNTKQNENRFTCELLDYQFLDNVVLICVSSTAVAILIIAVWGLQNFIVDKLFAKLFRKSEPKNKNQKSKEYEEQIKEQQDEEIDGGISPINHDISNRQCIQLNNSNNISNIQEDYNISQMDLIQ